MASNSYESGNGTQSVKITSTQGQAWDQLALNHYGSEKRMSALLAANPDEMDALLLEGGLEITVPKEEPVRVKSVPPWEKLK